MYTMYIMIMTFIIYIAGHPAERPRVPGRRPAERGRLRPGPRQTI